MAKPELINNNQSYTLIVDKFSYKVLDVSESMQKLYGYPTADLKQKKITELIPGFNEDSGSQGIHFGLNSKQFFATTYCSSIRIGQEAVLIITVQPSFETPDDSEATLVSLVTGLAHELNTPIGNILMASSFMSEANGKITFALDNKSLTMPKLKDALDSGEEAREIIDRSSKRLSEIIEQVKRIAVCLVFESINTFNVLDYSEVAFKKFSSQLKQKNIHYSINIPADLIITHDNVAYLEILQELINNTCLHAFNDNKGGNIFLSIKLTDKNVIINYADDGAGVSRQVFKRMYDPFFTTARNLGRVGLGLNIVDNMVSRRLNGNIVKKSKCNCGCAFEITFPLIDTTHPDSEFNVTEF